jgi:hypothetical protein
MAHRIAVRAAESEAVRQSQPAVDLDVKDLVAIEAVYSRIDGDLEQQRDTATAAGDAIEASRLGQRQRINDQAYFVLCWGQLEFEIDQRSRHTIRRRRNSRQWQTRRGWDLYNPDEPRLSGLSFENRAALVVDRQAGRGSPWARLMHHYQVRNQIAHGVLQAERIDVSATVADFYTIQAALASD